MLLFELVQYLDLHGIDIEVAGEKLRLSGDKALLGEEVTSAVKRYKRELIAYYQRQGDRGIVPCIDRSEFPLSFAQRRLFILYHYHTSQTNINEHKELELQGNLYRNTSD
jgi:hypothetical protein